MPPGALWRCRGRRDGHTVRADVVHGGKQPLATGARPPRRGGQALLDDISLSTITKSGHESVPAYARSGRLAEALRLLEQAVARGAMLLRGHASRHDSLRGTAFSEAYLLAGRLEEASTHAREALVLARTRKERGNEAWALRLLGEIAAQHKPSQPESAEDYYRPALTL